MQTAEIEHQLAKGFKPEEDLFSKGLDRALKSFMVQREAYYGLLIGDHDNKCLKVNTHNFAHTLILVNPWCACTVRVTVVALCVYLCVSVTNQNKSSLQNEV